MGGSALQLVLALLIMGISMTKFPDHLLYALFIWIGAATCLYGAFAVGHSGSLACIVLILSNIENVAAGSIPYGLVAVWNKAAEQAGLHNGIGYAGVFWELRNRLPHAAPHYQWNRFS